MSVYVEKTAKFPAFENKQQRVRHLDIELTERCNNNCVHCYINQPVSKKSKEMSAAFIEDLILQAVDLGCTSIRYTGGEPLLRPDFADLYTFTRRKGIRVMLFTNATLITDELLDLFKRIPPLFPIEVTLYGMHKESYEAVSRKPNTFDSAWAGIQALLNHNIPFIVKQACLPPNDKERQEFENWAENLPWMRHKPDYALNFDLRCRRDSEKRNEEIRQVRLSPERFVEITARDRKRYLNEMHQFMQKFAKPPGEKLFTCGAGRSSETIDSFGNLQVCLMVRHPHMVTSLYEYSLKDSIELLVQRKDALYSSNPEYRERCARCFLKSRCRQCPGTAWCEYGIMDKPVEYYCELTHAEARYLGLLQPGEKSWQITDWQKRIKQFIDTGS